MGKMHSGAWRVRMSHLVVVLGAGVMAMTGATAPALATEAREELERAQDYFLVADFGAALEKADVILATGGLPSALALEAWVLKARCEIGLSQRGNAIEAFCGALRMSPSWRPDPTLYTEDELDAFATAQERCGLVPSGDKGSPAMPPRLSAPNPWYKRPAILALGGTAVGVAIYLLLPPEDETEVPEVVPGFPPPPG